MKQKIQGGAQPKSKIPMADLKAQYALIREEIQAAMARVLASSQFILGPEVVAFERAFADHCGVRHAVGVHSGTSALYLALLALGVGPGDEIITVPFTFVATAEAVSWTGARPVFVDVDPGHYTMDPSKIEVAITKKTKGILPVHLYGHPADMDPILKLAERRGLFVLEDAAQAHGALYKGKRVGSFGQVACFSFYPSKNLGAYGEGGAIITSDDEIALRLRKLRNHGRLDQTSPHEFLGMNARMEALQAAILAVKLRHLDRWNELRRRHVSVYHQLLSSTGLVLPVEASYAKSAYHLYVVLSKHRDRLCSYLHERNVGAQIHYELPVHLLGFYRELGYREGDLPVTERLCKEVLSLPLYPEMTEDQLQEIADAVQQFEKKSPSRISKA